MSPNGLGICLGDGHDGGVVPVSRQVHVDDTGGIIVNDGGNGACLYGSIGLLGKGDAAPGANGDFSLQGIPQGSKVFCCAVAIQKDIGELAADRGHGLVGVALGGRIRIRHRPVPEGQVVAGEAGVIHRSHRQGIGIGAGRTGRCHAHAICIQCAAVCFLRPGARVTRRNGYDSVTLCQGVQNFSINVCTGIAAVARIGRAQGQVDGVAAQNDSVFYGGQIVGVIGASCHTEDLHDNELRIRRHPLDMAFLQRMGKASILPGNIGIGSRNACHVGAVLTGRIQDMGQVYIPVHVVETEGDLFVHIQGAGLKICKIQLIQNTLNLLFVQQVQLGGIGVIVHARILGIALEGVAESVGLEALMGDVNAGVNHSNAHTLAGVPGSVRRGAADLGAGGSHVGVCHLLPVHHRGGVAGLQDHILHAWDSLYRLNLAILQAGRDDVGGQGHIPMDLQLLSQGLADLGGDCLLVRPQGLPISHSCIILRNPCGRKSGLQSGFLLQENGNPHHIRIPIGSFLLRFRHNGLFQPGIQSIVVNLGYGHACFLYSQGRICAAQDQQQRQGQGQRPDKRLSYMHRLLSSSGTCRG